VVLQEELVGQAKKLLRSVPRENILGEPVGRNTAPCCVYAASQIAKRDPHAKLVFLPADQYIAPKSLFLKTLKTAFEIVDDRPVLLGMKPKVPHTGYGYLEVSRKKRKIRGISYFTVTRFHEKPNQSLARQFIRKGNFLWNGGTFVWRLDAFRRAIRKHFPRLHPAFHELAPFPGGTGRKPARARIYKRLPSISIDYAVMEKMKNVHCLLAPFAWSDLGGWLGLAEFWPRDSRSNYSQGKTLFLKAGGNIVKADKRLVVLLGVNDQLVVDTEDALLICPLSQTEEIRDVVRELERQKATHYL